MNKFRIITKLDILLAKKNECNSMVKNLLDIYTIPGFISLQVVVRAKGKERAANF